MTSVIFNSIGLGGIDPAILFFVIIGLFLILFILVIVQTVRLSGLKKTYNRFMDGKNGKSMEHEIMTLFDDIRYLKYSTRNADKEIAAIKRNLSFAYQKVGIVRYDAFKEMGGRLSFSIALLNDINDGFIINSVHSSGGCYTYTKDIVNGESAITLGEEEREALDIALKSNYTAVKEQEALNEKLNDVVDVTAKVRKRKKQAPRKKVERQPVTEKIEEEGYDLEFKEDFEYSDGFDLDDGLSYPNASDEYDE